MPPSLSTLHDPDNSIRGGSAALDVAGKDTSA